VPLAPRAEPAYEVIERDGVDTARQRAVPWRLYLPRAASASRPVPMVVFSHGIGGSRQGYSYLGRHWAGEGVASLHVQHVGSDRQLWFGNVFTLPSRLREAATDGEAIARPQDTRFALDQVLRSELGERIDAGALIAAGHSYGANTTLLSVGAVVERGGRLIDLHDQRYRAAIVISAPPFYGEREPQRILGGVRVPSLHITCTEDVIRIPGYFSDAADRIAVYEATGGPAKALAVFEGGSHSMFTDRVASGGIELNRQVKAATQDLSLAFLQRVTGRRDAPPLRGWAERFAPIVARYAESVPS
jgi:dienelactone hydrolase